jgi:tRNA 2-thiouridine synthesizing protein A
MERVDVTGEVCPRPALIVRRRLSDLEPGEALLVRGDYPPAEENLRRTCRKHGFDVDEAGDGDGDDFELRIAATEDAEIR